MAIIHAPYIEGTIPAFGPTLLVPYEMNRAVSLEQVTKFVVRIMDLNNNVMGYLETNEEGDINKNPLSFKLIENTNTDFTNALNSLVDELDNNLSSLDPSIESYKETQQKFLQEFLSSITEIQSIKINGFKKGLSKNQYYKIQLAYSDGEVDNSKLVYSSVGIGKYFGDTEPTITNSPTTDDINVISYTINNSGEELYSLIVINSENKELQELYLKQNQPEIGIVNLATEDRYVKGKTINGYITVSEKLKTSTFDEESIINNLLQNTDNEHIYLVSKNKTLCVKFNPKISSFKTTIQETKTDTIGGKYPVFYRNGTLGYKEFPINGLISYHMDEKGDFMTKTELGLETEKSVRVKTANGESAAALNIPTHNLVDYNIAAERKFRNAVLDWLNNGEVKLFKSPTEGMFLVRLMNISLSPEEKLGRMIYSFSATAYEVGEVNYENLVKYGFIDKIEGVDYVIR